MRLLTEVHDSVLFFVVSEVMEVRPLADTFPSGRWVAALAASLMVVAMAVVLSEWYVSECGTGKEDVALARESPSRPGYFTAVCFPKKKFLLKQCSEFVIALGVLFL